MITHLKQLENVSGDTLIITVTQPVLPLKGMAEIVDWRLNSLLSRMVIEEKYDAGQGNILLLPCRGKLPVDRTIIVGLDKNIKYEIVKILKGFKSKECSITFPKGFKKDLKSFFFDEILVHSFSWEKIEEKDLGDENLIVLTKIQYG